MDRASQTRFLPQDPASGLDWDPILARCYTCESYPVGVLPAGPITLFAYGVPLKPTFWPPGGASPTVYNPFIEYKGVDIVISIFYIVYCIGDSFAAPQALSARGAFLRLARAMRAGRRRLLLI